MILMIVIYFAIKKGPQLLGQLNYKIKKSIRNEISCFSYQKIERTSIFYFESLLLVCEI